MSAAKLEEKNQKILRTLLQQTENKKCADCTAKGPVYANTTFNTFVCTTCSGIHREFNHRVKSVSMATFKPDEIDALQKGGNQVAHDHWLARWTPDDYPEPDPNDKDRIRQYIRLKYVDKRWIAGGIRDQEKGGRNGLQQNGSRSQSSNKTTTGFSTPSKPTAPRVEPLQSVLGNDIPPIRVEKTVPPPTQQQNNSNSFFDTDFETNWKAAPFNPPQTTSAPVIDPFKPQETQQHQQPPQQQQNPNPQDKAASLKNQINAMFSTVQQPTYPNQFQQFPGQQQQFPGQFPAQQQQFPGQFPQQQQFPGQFPPQQQQFSGQQQFPGQFPPQQQFPGQFPGQQQQFPGQQQQFPGQFPPQQQFQQQQFPGQQQQFPGQQQQFPGQFPPQQQFQQQQFPGQFPGQQQQQFPGQFPGQQQQWGAPPPATVIAPVKVEPEKPDPFASLSLSSLSKQTPKPAPGPSMGTTSIPTNTLPISPTTSNNNDIFGFSTSPQKPTNMGQSEFNPFGMSQNSHVKPPQQQQQQNNDFNPFF